MICRRVHYTNFRNIEEAEIQLSPGVNLLYGDNAQGKTNALEGIYLCAQGRSHRVGREKDYILYGADFAKVRLLYEDGERSNVLELRYLKNNRKICKKNNIPLKKMSEFIGNFRAVIFCPEYLSIVRDGPTERRSYMDTALSQLDSAYLLALQNYSTALLQRNKLISNYAFDKEAFDATNEFWVEQLSENGEILSEKRRIYLEKAEKSVKEIFFDMTGDKEKPELIYKKIHTRESLRQALLDNTEREIRAGTTLFGPHKDDIEILLNGKAARIFASQGQQRSLAVAMKLAEGEISKEEKGEYPVFLLDDVLSELDDKRKAYILSGFQNRQVIITCCDAADAEKIGEGRVISVEKGQYTQIR